MPTDGISIWAAVTEDGSGVGVAASVGDALALGLPVALACWLAAGGGLDEAEGITDGRAIGDRKGSVPDRPPFSPRIMSATPATARTTGSAQEESRFT